MAVLERLCKCGHREKYHEVKEFSRICMKCVCKEYEPSALVVEIPPGNPIVLEPESLHIGEKDDPVNHPKHYNQHPSGVECIDIVQHFNFNIGNAIKYLWRAGLKGDAYEDLQKAKWYIEQEIGRMNDETK